MAIDLTGLQEYVELYPELIGKLMNRDSILQYMVRHLGATPGKYRYRLFETKSNFQDCCTIPTGSSKAEEREAEVVCILDGDEYCELDFAKLIRDASQRWGAGREKAPKAEAIITQQQLISTQLTLDKLVMLGDTANADNNLNRLDGIVKQATLDDDSNVVQLAGTSALQMVRTLIARYLQNPNARLFGNINVYVGTDIAGLIQFELPGLNLYHYNPGTLSEFTPFALPGNAGVRVIPTHSLDGTGIMFASPEQNLHWLTSVADDHMHMEWDYEKYRQLYYWRIKFLLGVHVAFPEYCYIGEFDPDVLAVAPLAMRVDANILNDPLRVTQVNPAVTPALLSSGVNDQTAAAVIKQLQANPALAEQLARSLGLSAQAPTGKPKRAKTAKPADETQAPTDKSDEATE